MINYTATGTVASRSRGEKLHEQLKVRGQQRGQVRVTEWVQGGTGYRAGGAGGGGVERHFPVYIYK